MFLSKTNIQKLKAYDRYLFNHFSHTKNIRLRYVFHFLASILSRVVCLINAECFVTKNKAKMDFLFLPVCVQDAQKLEGIASRLKASGCTVTIEVQKSFKDKFRQFQFCWVPLNTPVFLVSALSNALFYIKKYQPKIVVFVQNAGVFPSAVRLAQGGDALTVNLSHGVTFNDELFSSFDYDYYFMFGKTSLKHANSNSFRYGSTNVILSGSPFIDIKFSQLEHGSSLDSILYCSQWVPQNDVYELCRSHKILIEFAKRNPKIKILIKLHPLENGMFWDNSVSELLNVTVLASSVTLIEALRKSSICIVSYSNVAIEASMANRPLVFIDITGIAEEYFGVSDYFIVTNDLETFENAILEVKSKYEYYLESCRRFSSDNLERKNDSQEFISNSLVKIVKGENMVYDSVLEESGKWV